MLSERSITNTTRSNAPLKPSSSWRKRPSVSRVANAFAEAVFLMLQFGQPRQVWPLDRFRLLLERLDDLTDYVNIGPDGVGELAADTRDRDVRCNLGVQTLFINTASAIRTVVSITAIQRAIMQPTPEQAIEDSRTTFAMLGFTTGGMVAASELRLHGLERHIVNNP